MILEKQNCYIEYTVYFHLHCSNVLLGNLGNILVSVSYRFTVVNEVENDLEKTLSCVFNHVFNSMLSERFLSACVKTNRMKFFLFFLKKCNEGFDVTLKCNLTGITRFDLLGDFGRFNWLGNFYIVLSYNLLFAIMTTLCLVRKFTSAVREELLKALGNRTRKI